MSGVVALPTSGDQTKWTASEAALVEAAGLVAGGGQNKRLAPRPVVEAFLLQCQRTGLDPIARQIYCIERGGKWTTQVSIDGARLVAERSKQYQGQTPTEWTADGREWTEVWLSKEPPAAARVGVYRQGFQAPLFAVATYDAYNAGTPIWKKMPALMLGKCAEMLALRKAFPQDLSGLYSAEEMQQAETPAAAPSAVTAPPPPPFAPAPAAQSQAQPELDVIEGEVVPDRDWVAEAQACTSMEQLRALHQEADNAGALALRIDAEGHVLGQLMRRLKQELVDREKAAAEKPAPARDWLGEARAAESRAQLQALVSAAADAGVGADVLQEMAVFEDSLPPADQVDWNAAASQTSSDEVH